MSAFAEFKNPFSWPLACRTAGGKMTEEFKTGEFTQTTDESARDYFYGESQPAHGEVADFFEPVTFNDCGKNLSEHPTPSWHNSR